MSHQSAEDIVAMHSDCVETYQRETCTLLDELAAAGYTSARYAARPQPQPFRSFYLSGVNLHTQANAMFGPFPLETAMSDDYAWGPRFVYTNILIEDTEIATYADDWQELGYDVQWTDSEGRTRHDGWRGTLVERQHQANGTSTGHNVHFGAMFTDIGIKLSTREPMNMNDWNRTRHDPNCQPYCGNTPLPAPPLPAAHHDAEPDMDDLCGTCGERYGGHSGWACPNDRTDWTPPRPTPAIPIATFRSTW